jgi:hypothetical protein
VRAAAIAICCLLAALAGCSDDDDASGAAPASTTTAADDSGSDLHLNEIQVLGSHNSYHQQVDPEVFDALVAFAPDIAKTLEYEHPPLDVQLAERGIRQIELDVYADPDGGRYAEPGGLEIVQSDAEVDPALREPGFKVFHVQDVDFRSTCPTLVDCLTVVHDWSEENPGHVPVMILIEVKDTPVPGAPEDLGFVVPPPITAADLDALDAEILSVFDDDEVITPDDVRGDHDSLEEAIAEDGWPLLDDVRGQVLFALDNTDEVRDLYLDGHPALEGRTLFVSAEPGTPAAAFAKRNDPFDPEIPELVRAGYVVRTRADADTEQARTGDTTMRDAALASGAQWVSTDYAVDDPDFPPEYHVEIPEGTPGRCNPVIAPPDCEPTEVEDPAELAG